MKMKMTETARNMNKKLRINYRQLILKFKID